MVSKQVTVTNAQGVHMRPAGELAGKMSQYPCEVKIRYRDKTIDAKSPMNLIAACIKCGAQIEVVCEGEEEQSALDAAVAMIEAGFGE